MSYGRISLGLKNIRKNFGLAVFLIMISGYIFHMEIKLREGDQNTIFNEFPADDLPYVSFNLFNPEDIIAEEQQMKVER